jgi:UMF1 family MFS transporter
MPGASGFPVLLSWCLYDWANSAFPAVISTFVFAVYFTQNVAADPVSGSVVWSQAVTGAGLAIALLSPVFGAVADQTGRQKVWLIIFTMICVVSCALLWFIRPNPDHVGPALMIYVTAAISFGIAMVFYDAMLTRLVSPDRFGRLSGIGWAAGYIGGLICLLVVLFAFVEPNSSPLAFDREEGEHVRAATVFVALWYLLFSLPLFLSRTEESGRSRPLAEAVRAGLHRLAATLRGMPGRPAVARYLVAHMLAADGLTTLILFGGVYAAGTFGFGISEILLFAVALYVLAGLGAAGFGWLDDRIGSKTIIMLALSAIFVLVAGLVMAQTKLQFWILGTGLGLFIGPAQSSSRSLMARLTPSDVSAEYFGLYSLAGKITVFVGPLLFGLMTSISHSQRAGFAVILLFLGAGLIVLRSVQEPGAER